MSTANNKQHPKTSRKDRNKSMKIEKNPKHTSIIPEITPLCFASVKVLSFSSSCRTRSFITHNKHILFLVTPQTLLLCQLLCNQPRKNISSPKRLCSRCVSVPSSRPKKKKKISPINCYGRPKIAHPSVVFLHLQSSLAAQEWLLLEVAWKDKKNKVQKKPFYPKGSTITFQDNTWGTLFTFTLVWVMNYMRVHKIKGELCFQPN